MNLSFARAESIKNMLINKGFISDNISILAKGDLEPAISKPDGKNIESENRRVEVFLSK